MYDKDVVLANRQQVQMVESSGLEELIRVEDIRTEMSDSFKDPMERWEGREKAEGSQPTNTTEVAEMASEEIC